jgi:hypothetical protein
MAFEDTKSQNSESSDGKDFENLRNSRRIQRNESISKHNRTIQQQLLNEPQADKSQRTRLSCICAHPDHCMVFGSASQLGDA